MKVLIVDDEPLARERLLRLLQRVEPEAQCLQAADGAEALQVVTDEEPDLVLLDIRMPRMDGIEVAAKLDQLPSPPAVVFCTAYDEYALQALQHQTIAYLLKPVREGELQRALDSAGRVNRLQLASLQQAQDTGDTRRTISSHTHRGFESMPVDDVRCFVAGQKYVTAMSGELELLLPDTLKELEQEFASEFIRVHRNALVAERYVQRLEKSEDGSWRVILDGLQLEPAISRRHLSTVKQRLAER